MKIDPTTHRTMSERSYHGATSRSLSGRVSILVNGDIPQSIVTLKTKLHAVTVKSHFINLQFG